MTTSSTATPARWHMPRCSIVHGRDGDLVGPNGGINVHGTDFELGAVVEDLATGERRPQVYFEAPLTDAALLRRAAAWLEAVV